MRQKKDNIIRAISCFMCFIASIFSFTYANAQEQNSSFSNERYSSFNYEGKMDTQQIKILFDRGAVMAYKDIDSALLLFRAGFQQSRTINYLYGMTNITMAISQCYEIKNDYERAYAMNDKAYTYCVMANNPKLFLNYYTHMARYYKNRGINDSSVYYYHQVLKKVRQYPTIDSADNAVLSVYQNLGTLYLEYGQHNFQAAFFYLRKAEQIALKNGDSESLASVYLGMGAAYANMSDKQDYKQAIYYEEKAIQLLGKQNNSVALGIAYCNLGIMNINLGKTTIGINFIKKALQNSEYVKKNPSSPIRPYLALGMAYLKLNNYREAELYLDQARKASEVRRSGNDLLEIYPILAHLYLQKNDFKNAFAAQQRYSSLKDSLSNDEKAKITAQLDGKYRSVEKDKEIALNRLNLNAQRNRIREQRIWIVAGIGSSALLAGLLLLLYRNSRQRRHLQEGEMQQMEQQKEIMELKAMVKGERKKEEGWQENSTMALWANWRLLS